MKREVTVNVRPGALQRDSVALNRDIKHVLELRALLGEQRIALLTEDEHPLAAGLKLAPKWLVTRRMTQDEEVALQQTALFAKTFCEMRCAWEGHRKRMARDLLNADQCQARMVGMHAQTLRYYERVGVLKPSRSQGRIRLYSVADVNRLRQIHRLIDDLGVNLAGAEVILRMNQRIQEMNEELEALRRELQRLRDRRLLAPLEPRQDSG